MSTKFTPGPWQWVNPITDEPWDSVEEPDFLSLRTVEEFWDGRYKLPKFVLGAEEFRGDTTETDHANAHLIAAAPELYDALNSMLTFYDVDEEPGEVSGVVHRQAGAALAKARGQQE